MERATLGTRDWLLRLDSYANETHGRPVSSAVVRGTCVSCGGAARAFTTSQASSAYVQLGLCERCQNAHRPIKDNIVPFNQNYRTESS
jgi:hypothetical protein